MGFKTECARECLHAAECLHHNSHSSCFVRQSRTNHAWRSTMAPTLAAGLSPYICLRHCALTCPVCTIFNFFVHRLACQCSIWCGFICVHCTATGYISSRGLFLHRSAVLRHIRGSKPCFAADLGFQEIHVEARAGDVMAGAGGGWSGARRTSPTSRLSCRLIL